MAEQKRYAGFDAISTLVQNIKTKYSLQGHKHTSSDITDLDIPTKVSELTNDSGYVTNTAAAGTSLGLVKSGGDVTISNGVITVKDDSHNHVIGNVDGLQEALDSKASNTHNHDDAYESKGSSGAALVLAKEYTDTKTSGLASTNSVTSAISTHNTSTGAHNDIRGLITDLTTKLNNFLDVDDATTDQLSEVIELINNNKGTLESLTTSKVNVADIINNLTTNVSNKPLSAAQGVAIKALIDTLDSALDGKADASHIHTIANVTNLQSSLDAKVPTSRTVNNKALTDNITLSAADVGADATGSANTALTDAKNYTDTEVAKVSTLVGDTAVSTQISTAVASYAKADLSNVDNATFKTKVEESGFASGTQVQFLTWEADD